jgi:hypothetical protein
MGLLRPMRVCLTSTCWVNASGRERSLDKFRALLQQTGFVLTRVVLFRARGMRSRRFPLEGLKSGTSTNDVCSMTAGVSVQPV